MRSVTLRDGIDIRKVTLEMNLQFIFLTFFLNVRSRIYKTKQNILMVKPIILLTNKTRFTLLLPSIFTTKYYQRGG